MVKKVGGKRTGSGRKKAAYKTKTVSFRVRVEWEQEIKQVVKQKIFELNSK